jgi:eukaryotic-like serine/threonine-protein kinase
LQHPAIPPVHDLGTLPDGRPFLAMKLIKGQTLDALLKARPDPSVDRGRFVAAFEQVCQAVAYAHAHGVIHRDLKPANVMVGNFGEVQVMDWGLAKVLGSREAEATDPDETASPTAIHSIRESDSAFTQAGSVLGTPAYMPPEQAIGDKLDERADVYAIGAILYHALSGARPFAQAKTLDELLELVAFKTPTPLAQLAPELPPELVAIVEHAMARDPAQRYATAQGIAKDLRDFQAGKLVAAHEYTTWQLVRRWISQHKAVVATAAIALGVLIVVGAIGVWRIANERGEQAACDRAGRAQRRAGCAHARREALRRQLAGARAPGAARR